MAKENMYFVRLKAFEPGQPNIKFKPAVVKGLVVAANPKIAGQKAYDLVIRKVQQKFPKAELKQLECKVIPFDFFINP
ncbi:hypothetical protein MTO98_26740 [Mucilaginibacter sp. SMC90]|uniref:hypothetical protein n=1 Tax=Mucilaginibacter sp. SMC90 TaxID=2929803 RepID=UPI001FB38CA6|nr:hypothetical protein [Mucilaginibacter sp. SMC90]UOE48013.1 hypothetical protein MTO98_26740 [Mucilaginibacter sp. SMC90]